MSSIVHITDHADRAESRLPQQYVDQPNLTALVRLFGERAQPLEDTLLDMIENGGLIDGGHDSLLDQIGDVVGQIRAGLSDSDYKLRLTAKIFENVSIATPEILIKIFKILMQADRVYYNPLYPAGFALTAIGGTPLGSIPEIKAAIGRARQAGVGIDYFASVPSVAFSFFDDPDPNGQGFGDSTDASVGGYLAEVI